MLTEHEIEIRVRYQETDGQGRVHHANYFKYFEMGRVELLRAAGFSYKELEARGIMLVVAEIACRFHRGAEYDDILRLVTRTVRVTAARIEHEYQVFRGEELMAQGKSTIACIDRDGRAPRVRPARVGAASSRSRGRNAIRR